MMTGGRTGSGSGLGSGVVHPASANATIPREQGKLWRLEVIRNDMKWVLFAEAGVAMFLLVFIVWWTMYSGRKPDHEQQALPPAEKEEPPEQLDK
jgi:lysylphosphatidylglycerol synthetase-like protein (DUF2156 family)